MDSLCWFMVVAVNDESDSLESNKTWFLVDLLHDCQINGCKWFLEKKKNYRSFQRFFFQSQE
jgi:N-acyl-L-homoserine lactone synthetase